MFETRSGIVVNACFPFGLKRLTKRKKKWNDLVFPTISTISFWGVVQLERNYKRFLSLKFQKNPIFLGTVMVGENIYLS